MLHPPLPILFREEPVVDKIKLGHIVVAAVIAIGGGATAAINQAGGILGEVQAGTWVIAGVAGVVAGGKEWVALFPTSWTRQSGRLAGMASRPFFLGGIALGILAITYWLVSR
jgi:hypothetical protein